MSDALKKIARMRPNPVDETASDLDEIAYELYEHFLEAINLARVELGLEPWPVELAEDDEEEDEE